MCLTYLVNFMRCKMNSAIEMGTISSRGQIAIPEKIISMAENKEII